MISRTASKLKFVAAGCGRASEVYGGDTCGCVRIRGHRKCAENTKTSPHLF